MTQSRRHRRWRATHFLSIASLAVGAVGLACCLELLPWCSGKPALGCAGTAIAMGVWVVIDMQVRRRPLVWSVLGITAIAMGAAVLLLRVQS